MFFSFFASSQTNSSESQSSDKLAGAGVCARFSLDPSGASGVSGDSVATRSRAPKHPLRQRGETLIGLLLATGIAAAALGIAIEMQQRDHERLDAQQGGVLLAQTADGLRRLISAVPGNPAFLPASPQTGVNWLKSPTCGGLAANPPQGFVPCSFGDNFWTPAFQTTFTNVAGQIEARLTFVVPAAYSRPRAGVLADIIAEHANANLTTSVVNAPAPGVITPGFVTVMSHVRQADNNLANRPAIRANTADADFARLVVSVSNHANTDAFLRTDGSNRMNAALNLNNNDLINGRNLQAQTAALSGAMTAASATLTGAMTAQTAQANTLTLNVGASGAVRGGSCSPSGLVASDSAGLLLACQGGVWIPAGSERVPAFLPGVPNTCNRSGAMGELADGTTMICQGTMWIPLQARMGGMLQMGSFLVRNGSPVPMPSCNAMGAEPRIFVKPRAWFDGPVTLTASGEFITASTSDEPWFFGASVNGSAWTISIEMPRDRGEAQAEAIAITSCVFS